MKAIALMIALHVALVVLGTEDRACKALMKLCGKYEAVAEATL